MAKQNINVGTAPTGAGGDTFRSAAVKMQANTDEIYAQLGGTGTGNATLPAALTITKGGTGATTAAEARTNLGLTLTTSQTDTTSGSVMKVGDFGLGATSLPSIDRAVETLPGGFFKLPDGSTKRPSLMKEYDNYGIIFPRQATEYGAALFLPYHIESSKQICFRVFALSTYVDYYLRHSQNTTVDANGFIKNASPIVKLYANQIELNEEAELQEIAFEKVAVGEYLIKGSSGFAQEGWYIETPKDANGNVLFSVIYDTLENGDISVKTYKKKFDLETASIVADLDKPVDITDGRWIDIRLQALPQPEINPEDLVFESATPPEFQPTNLAQAVAEALKDEPQQ